MALYIRLSKEDVKSGESESISNQRSILKRFCISNNLRIFNEYVDDGISGTTFNRPGFERMIKDIEDKKINMVITKDLSRLGRDYIGVGHYLEKYFPEKGVRYISLLDDIDTGIDSSINDITPFKSILNDMYAKDISNKIKSVKHNKQELGLFIGSKAPFGYMTNKENPNKLIIDNEARVVVKRIFKEACVGRSCKAIANSLNIDGIETPSMYAISHNLKVSKVGLYWSDSRVREIILNEVYIGNMVQGRMKKLNYKSKKNIRLPKSKWKVVKGTHPAIIDEETFFKANKMLDIRKKTRIKSHDYILKGLVYCYECKKKMGTSSRKNVNRAIYYFRCNSYVASPQLKVCTTHSIRMDLVENIVFERIRSIVLNDIMKGDTFRSIAKSKIHRTKNKSDITKNLQILNIKLDKLEKDIDSLYSDKLSGILLYEDFARIYKDKIEEKNKIKDEIFNTKNKEYIFNINEDEYIESLASKFKNSFSIDREIICTLIEKIEIDKDKKIYIHFNFKDK